MPDVGGVDTSMYGRLQTPNMLETIGNAARASQAITQSQDADLSLHLRKLGIAQNYLSSLLAMPNPSQDDVLKVGTKLTSMGVLTPEEFSQTMTTLPRDPQQLRGWLTQHLADTMTATEKLQSMADPQMINLGNRVQGVTVNRLAGTVTPMRGAASQMVPGLSPEAATSPDAITLPNGQVVQTTRAGRTQAVGGGPDTSGVSPGAPGAPKTSGGNVPGIPAPGPMWDTGKKLFDSDSALGPQKLQTLQPLVKAIPLIEKLGPTGTGPLSKEQTAIANTLTSLGLYNPSDSASAWDQANKYLAQYAKGSPAASRSDAALYTEEKANPNLNTGNAATLALAKQAVAWDRMVAALPLSFDSQAKAGKFDQYQTYKQKWTQSQDPRAYGLDLMPPDKRQKLLSDMKAKANTEEGKKFWNSLRNADGAGLLNAGE